MADSEGKSAAMGCKGSPIVELSGFACKKQGQLGEDFVSTIGVGGLKNFEFLWGSDFFSIEDGPFFQGAFLVRSGFLNNNPPLSFAILKT